MADGENTFDAPLLDVERRKREFEDAALRATFITPAVYRWLSLLVRLVPVNSLTLTVYVKQAEQARILGISDRAVRTLARKAEAANTVTQVRDGVRGAAGYHLNDPQTWRDPCGEPCGKPTALPTSSGDAHVPVSATCSGLDSGESERENTGTSRESDYPLVPVLTNGTTADPEVSDVGTAPPNARPCPECRDAGFPCYCEQVTA